ncbi:hypothetical protein [Streptomyces sp. SLBN-31]|uniref:hypothetical protein n=1 Tax=Streptomyces sp. SLBN-31 TaxID=2768444 RepID=UPI0028C4A931|nr:hypothetical protein [Streptomyces sp. SLBN-31]
MPHRSAAREKLSRVADGEGDNLAALLIVEEGLGILRWLIGGAHRYLAGDRDLTGPERVPIGTTTAYAEAEDHTGRSYDECCRLASDLRAEQTTLHAAYTSWCRNEGALVMSSRAFAARTANSSGWPRPCCGPGRGLRPGRLHAHGLAVAR